MVVYVLACDLSIFKNRSPIKVMEVRQYIEMKLSAMMKRFELMKTCYSSKTGNQWRLKHTALRHLETKPNHEGMKILRRRPCKALIMGYKEDSSMLGYEEEN
nr:hypothetical protein Iba_chr04fCG10680 [Ipomoea batatas]GMC97510.1 hypothetical protein Iba_chr05dCG7700 [Ipomoea batatas]GMD31737.1 hypothetical protein Iba_chr09bCG1730 [Ipomoea batatas]GMD33527.1 hypothetical protein Iba_chr09cCG3430 [Ipomoea batatas]GME16906.1 hypothetical protein Iba_scaffold18029CG0020 [Ipomoea batatas]